MNLPITEYKKILFFCGEGLPFIIGLLLICIALSLASLRWANAFLILFCVIQWLLFFGCCYFFRDPERNVPLDPNVIVAPADGKIINIRMMKEGSFLQEECRSVSIFMNLFSVHVNRAPIAGTIKYTRYNPGKFISAFKEKASLDNEQVGIGIVGNGEGKRNIRVFMKLIAGLIARRIVLWKGIEDNVAKGERISLIKFGSRVDVYLPLRVDIKVKEGDWVKAGETIIGILT